MKMAAVAAMCSALYGCPSILDLPQSTKGTKGQLEFAVVGRPDCFLGCAVDRPFMAGTTQHLAVEPSGADLSARSSDTHVLTVTIDDVPVTVNGKAEFSSLLDATAVA